MKNQINTNKSPKKVRMGKSKAKRTASISSCLQFFRLAREGIIKSHARPVTEDKERIIPMIVFEFTVVSTTIGKMYPIMPSAILKRKYELKNTNDKWLIWAGEI